LMPLHYYAITPLRHYYAISAIATLMFIERHYAITITPLRHYAITLRHITSLFIYHWIILH
jgi:hypothetical protein